MQTLSVCQNPESSVSCSNNHHHQCMQCTSNICRSGWYSPEFRILLQHEPHGSDDCHWDKPQCWPRCGQVQVKSINVGNWIFLSGIPKYHMEVNTYMWKATSNMQWVHFPQGPFAWIMPLHVKEITGPILNAYIPLSDYVVWWSGFKWIRLKGHVINSCLRFR